MQKTYSQKPAEVKRTWHLVDVKGRVLGQVATEIAVKLMGKHKPTYTANIDGGDYVVVINASEVIVTGNKGDKKKYYDHSLMPGGIRTRTFNELQATLPHEIIERAVYTMLPSNRLRKDRMARLKISPNAEHKYEAEIKKGSN